MIVARSRVAPDRPVEHWNVCEAHITASSHAQIAQIAVSWRTVLHGDAQTRVDVFSPVVRKAWPGGTRWAPDWALSVDSLLNFVIRRLHYRPQSHNLSNSNIRGSTRGKHYWSSRRSPLRLLHSVLRQPLLIGPNSRTCYQRPPTASTRHAILAPRSAFLAPLTAHGRMSR